MSTSHHSGSIFYEQLTFFYWIRFHQTFILSKYDEAIPPFKGESDTSDNSPPEETANKGGTLRKVKSLTTPSAKKSRGGSDASPESSPEKRIGGRGGDGSGERSRRKKRPPLAQRGASAERGEAREVIDPPQQLTVPPR